MAESDGEIEYLEEDAEIVQQCVQSEVLGSTLPTGEIEYSENQNHQAPIRVQRTKTIKKKKDDDSDYDPSEDDLPPSPQSPPPRKKPPARKTKSIQGVSGPAPSVPVMKVVTKKEYENYQKFGAKDPLNNRKKFNIRIPDYDDPLCLPVRATIKEASDKKRLDNWNKVCLEHFKHCDTILKPERGETKSSIRTAVFRNAINKQTGYTESTIWSKTSVENEDGDKKSEIFQCVLPRYKERKMVTSYVLGSRKQKPNHNLDEVILSKEEHKEREALVVYKPMESVSAVYGLIDQRKSDGQEGEGKTDEEAKMFLRELACCKMCAPCYQTSWRGIKKKQLQKSLVCPACARTFVSMYNLLAHFKTHSSSDVQRYKPIISMILSNVVGYLYKCRMCGEKFGSIKTLRVHVKGHQGKETFLCEVGNHMVKC